MHIVEKHIHIHRDNIGEKFIDHFFSSGAFRRDLNVCIQKKSYADKMQILERFDRFLFMIDMFVSFGLCFVIKQVFANVISVKENNILIQILYGIFKLI